MPCMPDGYSEDMCGNYSDDDGGVPLYCEPESTQGQGSDKLCNGESSTVKYAMSISNWTDVSSSDSLEIAQSLVDIGPLSIVLDASKLQFYKSGIFNPPKCGTAMNHAVLMVGFGTGVDEDTGDDLPFWTVKNSWGADYGEDGYFRIVRTDDEGTCGINLAVTSGLI